MQNLSFATNVIFTGLVVVFTSLILLSFLISLFKLVFVKKPNKTDGSDSVSGQGTDSSATTQSDNNVSFTDESSDSELIAVLTAAIMASGFTRPDSKIRIKSYRRVPISSPVWNVAGRTEVISSRL